MLFQLVLFVVGWLTYVYYKTWRKMSHFRRMGLDEDPGFFPFGSQANWDVNSRKIALVDTFKAAYPKFREKKLYGWYGMMGAPQLVVQDQALIKDVLIRDFDHFVDRRDIYVGDDKYITNMLTMIEGDKWKAMRYIMTPVFTTGKLRGMVKFIDKAADEMVGYLQKFADEGTEFECKELFTLFGVDVVASTGFGFDANSFTDPHSIFRDQLDKLTNRGKYELKGLKQFQLILMFGFPGLAKLLGLNFFNPSALKFFINIIKTTIEQRKKSGHNRNDFIDVMLQGFESASGELQEEDDDQDQFHKDAEFKPSSTVKRGFETRQELEDVVICNAFLLFFAGFDTSSTTMATTAYFLATNPDAQAKLLEEINEALADAEVGQHLDYQQVQKLPYLEGCILEALRLYPVVVGMERKCVKDYTFRGTNVTIKAGTLVQIPDRCMMKDERYWENPEVYDPTRFSEEEVAKRGPYDFFAFGHGPRNCIGKRFALLQTKIAILRLVANYQLVKCERTVDELVADPASINILPVGRMWIKCVKRKDQ